VSQNTNTTRVNLLIEQYELSKESLAKDDPYGNASEMTRVNERILLHRGIFNKMLSLGMDDLNEQQRIYKDEFLPAFSPYKNHFIQSAQKIMRVDNEENRHQFEIATKQYYQALDLLLKYQQIMAEAFLMYNRVNRNDFNERFGYVEAQNEILKDEVDFFKKKVNEVSLHLADKKMKSLKGHEISIQAIAEHYEKAYEDSYGRFWGWVKNIFRKSDRAKEIEFLNTISKHTDCEEPIRVQAAALVHNKILASELFGKGSQLAKVLENFLTGKDMEQGNLVQFLDDHEEIKGIMPESLTEYFEEHQEDYNKERTNTISFQ